MTTKGKPYAVVRHYSDNPDDFAVIEYFAYLMDADEYISKQPASIRHKLEVRIYE